MSIDVTYMTLVWRLMKQRGILHLKKELLQTIINIIEKKNVIEDIDTLFKMLLK